MLLQHLRQVRKEAGLTQKQLAERLQPTSDLSPEQAQLVQWQSQRFVFLCESGQRRIDVMELRTLCRALGIDYLELLHKLEPLLD